MNTFLLAWKNLTQQIGATLLSIVLTAFGVSILLVIYLTADSFEKQLENNSKGIDLVVGAKGSPMQLILSSLYHVDNPTGNIALTEAQKIADNPLVQLATPIALGDNYKGHRIIGTDATFLQLYDLKITDGKIWKSSFEIVIGADVQKKHNLKIGDKIFSAHGLSPDAHSHDDHPFKIVGVLNKANSVVDNLILTNLASVWEVHGIEHNGEHIHNEDCNHDHSEHHDHKHESQNAEDEHNHNHEHNHKHEIKEEIVSEKPFVEGNLIKNIGEDILEDKGVEITALLIKYSSPVAISIIPKMVNQSTHMQAASPAIESSRIFSLLGVGLDSLEILAYVIMIIAALSIFISLYNAMKTRKYDLAIMRTLGAAKTKLFTLVLVEGLVITLIGGILGLIVGHFILYYISLQSQASSSFIEIFQINIVELYILLAALAIGIIAAVIPAIKAYKTTISKTLASK